MNDVNYIKGQLQSWRACINWVAEIYPEKLYKLEHKLKNVKGISYEEKQGGHGIDESLRRSMIIDEINILEKEKQHCESVIDFCEKLMDRVKPQYEDVFRYKYSTYSTESWIAWKTGYEEEYLRQIFRRETERLSNE